jgi:hypothetical protein
VVELARGYAMRLKVATAVLALALLGLIAFTVYDRWPQGEAEYHASQPAYVPSPTATVCPTGYVYMSGFHPPRCVRLAASCAATERYDVLRQRCVPRDVDLPQQPVEVPTIDTRCQKAMARLTLAQSKLQQCRDRPGGYSCLIEETELNFAESDVEIYCR